MNGTWKFRSHVYTSLLEPDPRVGDRWINIFMPENAMRALSVFQAARAAYTPLIVVVEGIDAEECAVAAEQVFAGGYPSIWRAVGGLDTNWERGALLRRLW